MRKIIVAGFLGNDAQVNDLPSGNMQVINFNVATTDNFKEEIKTVWVKCSRFTNNVAISPYLKKGTYVIVTGRAEVEQYQDQSGQTKSVLKCIVDEIKFGGAKSDNQSNDQHQQSTPQSENNPQKNPKEEEHDDLPF
jgi:single stranded DNA-binding protein